MRGAIPWLVLSVLPRPADDRNIYGMVHETLVYNLAKFLFGDELVHLMRRVSDAEVKANGESYWLHAAEGCLKLWHDKNDSSAFDHFYRGSKELRLAQDVYHISCGLDAMRPLNTDLHSLTPRLSLNELTFAVSPRNLTKLVHLAAADDKYFEKYAVQIASSTAAFVTEGIGLHLHCLNPTEASMALAGELTQTYSHVSFSYSFHDFAIGITANTRRALYASIRFCIAPILLRDFGCPVVITDIDIVVDKPYENIIKVMGDAPAAFSFGLNSMRSFYPWLRVAAGVAIFNPSEAGVKLAEEISLYFRCVYDEVPGAQNWLIDQIALWFCLERAMASGIEVRKTRLAEICHQKKVN